MIIGIGIDLVPIKDFAEKLENEAFIRKVFAKEEIDYCRTFKKSAEHFAGKFAAKEAFMKAIGKGIQQGIWFQQIQVINKITGAPEIKTFGEALMAVNELGAEKVHLSISHTNEHAVAIVILESPR